MQFGDWEAVGAAGALSLGGPLGAYAGRNLAIGLTMGVALLRRAPAMLLTVFILRFFTETFDVINNLSTGNLPIASFSMVFLVIDLLAIRALWALHKQG